LFLESLFLPLLLSSILFAIYVKHPENQREDRKRNNVSLVPISGVLMGLASFTKMPVFSFIPLVSYIIFTKQ